VDFDIQRDEPEFISGYLKITRPSFSTFLAYLVPGSLQIKYMELDLIEC